MQARSPPCPFLHHQNADFAFVCVSRSATDISVACADHVSCSTPQQMQVLAGDRLGLQQGRPAPLHRLLLSNGPAGTICHTPCGRCTSCAACQEHAWRQLKTLPWLPAPKAFFEESLESTFETVKKNVVLCGPGARGKELHRRTSHSLSLRRTARREASWPP